MVRGAARFNRSKERVSEVLMEREVRNSLEVMVVDVR